MGLHGKTLPLRLTRLTSFTFFTSLHSLHTVHNLHTLQALHTLPFGSESCVVHIVPKKTQFKIYTTINISNVLYGCETWPGTLRKERRLRVFNKTILRKIFGPGREEVKDEWRTQRGEVVRDL